MKKSLLILNVSILILLTSNALMAQEVITTCGSQNSSGSNQVYWTIGEVAVSTLNSGSITLTEGFHQTNLAISSIKQLTEIPFKILAYPNPVSDEITLKIEEYKVDNLTYHLFNIEGKELSSKAIEDTETKIDFTALPAATYLLRVSDNKKDQVIITIIKTK